MKDKYLNIEIDYSRDDKFNQSGLSRLKEGYMLDNEKSPQERFAYVASCFGSNPEHAQRMYEYISKFWLSCSTPILSYGKTPKSLPISCFSSYLGDNLQSILEVSQETRMMAISGGGVAVHVGLRPGDKKSSGIMAHLKTYDADLLAYKQGTSRRGSTAAYLDVNHPEILEFIEMRKPTGGDPNRKCLNLHHGVNLNDDFMNRVDQLSTNKDLTSEEKEELDKYPLIDPNTGSVHSYASVKNLWQRILETRMETGEPYCHFIDTANDHLPKYQKDKGLKIRGSNLCVEISLVTDLDRSLVCCLSSLNLEKYDEYKDPIIFKQFVSDVVEFLDNVIEVFIDKTKLTSELTKARRSAMMERPIGIGALGWHSYLQSKGMPFSSAMAMGLNAKIWKDIKEYALEATQRLGYERGVIPDAIESGLCIRNSHLLSLAPNAASSYILNTSPSCEMYKANAYLEKGINGTVLHKNKHLEKLLESKGLNTKETWSMIIANNGSASTLDCLTDYEKEVYQTADEVDQTYVIEQAATRQKYICQSQSINLYFKPTEDIRIIHLTHLLAWKMGMKSLYYCRSDALRKADKVDNKVKREKIEELSDLVNKNPDDICISCQ